MKAAVRGLVWCVRFPFPGQLHYRWTAARHLRGLEVVKQLDADGLDPGSNSTRGSSPANPSTMLDLSFSSIRATASNDEHDTERMQHLREVDDIEVLQEDASLASLAQTTVEKKLERTTASTENKVEQTREMNKVEQKRETNKSKLSKSKEQSTMSKRETKSKEQSMSREMKELRTRKRVTKELQRRANKQKEKQTTDQGHQARGQAQEQRRRNTRRSRKARDKSSKKARLRGRQVERNTGHQQKSQATTSTTDTTPPVFYGNKVVANDQSSLADTLSSCCGQEAHIDNSRYGIDFEQSWENNAKIYDGGISEANGKLLKPQEEQAKEGVRKMVDQYTKSKLPGSLQSCSGCLGPMGLKAMDSTGMELPGDAGQLMQR
eukprot:CAMPEP_0178993434 /NCGR_PEP_ID=MMETSP0795-20121207/6701_1 /TAXON_ID=88552 /ORGANISM="Amoebophrya sp., Strain Ameob2" /LENGTH=377 /DNA_ID=CAMNT_0020685493 /DNA_START=268 /DNA_END=1401 /DNA_ORIENTATION=+